jgi:hypothetical protein
MAEYEVAERHRIRVSAPAEATFEAATSLNLEHSKIISGLFKTREFILGGQQSQHVVPKPLLAWAQALGWGILAQIPGREVVLGAVTKPWEPNVVFRPLRPEDFGLFGSRATLRSSGLCDRIQ